jgi:hypothetical protein
MEVSPIAQNTPSLMSWDISCCIHAIRIGRRGRQENC